MTQPVDELDYGDVVPGVTCPECGGELVYTSNGAFCDWCESYVPVVGSAVVIDEVENDDDEWTDEDESVS